MPPSTAKLPEYRFHFEFSFENVELDYTGPLYTRDIYSSDKETYIICYRPLYNIYKCYILIFMCATTRDTHLESVLTELSESLLLALRRFVARKGLPSAFVRFVNIQSKRN